MRLDSTRERRPTAGFGWVDHRVVRGGHLATLSQSAVAVYLVLCVVADRKGISYYSPTKLGELVKHSAPRVEAALEELAERGLIAREGRFMQVLPLEAAGRAPASSGNRPGVDTEAGRTSAPVSPSKSASAPVSESPEIGLESLPAAEREVLLERARQRLRDLAGSREPSLAVVLAVASGLARGERAS